MVVCKDLAQGSETDTVYALQELTIQRAEFINQRREIAPCFYSPQLPASSLS